MSPDNHALIVEASAYAKGLQTLFSNMEDCPLEHLQPFEMVMMLRPVTDRLNQLLDDENDLNQSEKKQ